MGSITSPRTIVSNARIFTSEPNADELINGCLIIRDGKIDYVGDEAAEEVEFGGSLEKLDLIAYKTLDDIRAQIRQFAKDSPNAPRLMCKGWLQISVPGTAMASMLDDIDPRPIYVEAMDLHSMWLNTAALVESGIMATEVDPDGGKIHRDAEGRPSGLVEEGPLVTMIWPFLADALSKDEKHVLLQKAFEAYTAAGYTGVIDMAMDSSIWSAMELYRSQNETPFHIAAHWLVPYSDDTATIDKHLQKAIEMNGRYHPSTSPDFCIVGIKIIGDGTVDGCTAGLSEPYNTSTAQPPTPVDPIWPYAQLKRLVHAADAADLQIAIHAIGDKTINDAINALASLPPNPPYVRRHRIEHLELTSPSDARRLGELGIIASVQPVHSDPVLFRAWPTLIGPHRCKRAFAYKEFLDGGATLALGTDAPTAPHWPLRNLYNATTRKSALDLECKDTVNEEFRLGLADAVRGVTSGAAYSRRADGWTGRLKVGASADFVLVELGGWGGEEMIRGRVLETWFRGKRVYDSKA
ncbi:putative amidohydrolase YtcJ [Cyphellophora attinorum]|uniref:Putative amidohydrolase YtcJ n=1 Tax=Cyphellophora attinorum TaxID=1664694 RepID=A0A0N1HSA6_9EURO|nr:putative amidohydrolase YtcJ [Phialophora attinorum]KPI41443.1 putative amidohydrolase YtcJ [Phialophora attinorum]